MRVWAYVLFALLSGCGIGGFWMNGDPSGGRNIVPLSDYWSKADSSPEKRRQDWVGCGGTDKGGYTVATVGLTDAEALSAFDRKFDGLQYCMMEKGYHYTDSCEGEIPSQFPACKARQSAE